MCEENEKNMVRSEGNIKEKEGVNENEDENGVDKNEKRDEEMKMNEDKIDIVEEIGFYPNTKSGIEKNENIKI